MISCPVCKGPPVLPYASCRCGRIYAPSDGPSVFAPGAGNPLESDYLISVKDGMVIVVDCRPGGPGVVMDPEDPELYVEEALLLACVAEVLQS